MVRKRRMKKVALLDDFIGLYIFLYKNLTKLKLFQFRKSLTKNFRFKQKYITRATDTTQPKPGQFFVSR